MDHRRTADTATNIRDNIRDYLFFSYEKIQLIQATHTINFMILQTDFIFVFNGQQDEVE